jgi:hypothetical protein
MSRTIAPSVRCRVKRVPEQVPLHREFIVDDAAALLEPVVDHLALLPIRSPRD